MKRSSVWLSVHPSVCPINHKQQRPPAGLLLSATWAGDSRRGGAGVQPAATAPATLAQRSAANAGIVTLTADGGS